MMLKDMFLWDELKKTMTPLAQAPRRTSFLGRIFRPRLGHVLDLHGLTVQQAFDTFQSFLQQHIACRTHTITVITGKGRDGQGAIYREFPVWLTRSDVKDKIETIQNLGGSFVIGLKWHKK